MTALAMKQKGLKPAAKIVLYWLADHHNSETGKCFPSLKTLASECEMDVATVKRHLKHLEDMGIIHRHQRHRENGSQASTQYTLQMIEPLAQNAPPPSAKCANPLAQKRTPHNLVNNNLGIKPKDIAHSEHDRFDDFWSEVPRKIGKGQARKAWNAAVKKTDAETLIAGIRRFAAEKRGHDPQFIAHPATWLNGERWEDDATRQPQELHDQIENQLKGKANGLSIEDADSNGTDERFSAQLPAPTSPDGRTGAGRNQEHCGGSERSLRDFINPRRFP